MIGQALAGGCYRYDRGRRSYADYPKDKCDYRYLRVELLVLREVAKFCPHRTGSWPMPRGWPIKEQMQLLLKSQLTSCSK